MRRSVTDKERKIRDVKTITLDFFLSFLKKNESRVDGERENIKIR